MPKHWPWRCTCVYCGKSFKYGHRCTQGGGTIAVNADSFQIKMTIQGVIAIRTPIITFDKT